MGALMHELPTEERTDFPAAGARARRWRRFEDGLRAWLGTCDGQFHTWRARRLLEADGDPLSAAPR